MSLWCERPTLHKEQQQPSSSTRRRRAPQDASGRRKRASDADAPDAAAAAAARLVQDGRCEVLREAAREELLRGPQPVRPAVGRLAVPGREGGELLGGLEVLGLRE